jgi:hypothetical protein
VEVVVLVQVEVVAVVVIVTPMGFVVLVETMAVRAIATPPTTALWLLDVLGSRLVVLSIR